MSNNSSLPTHPVIAIAGATGAVGQEMLKIIESRDVPYSKLKLLASKRSSGTELEVKGQKIVIEEMRSESFEDVDIALFAAGSNLSKEYLPYLKKYGCVMIDNSSAFRMDKDVPLVVPEVNPEAALKHSGVIANPNCSTIQMVVALKPLNDISPIKRVVVSTYQAASGAGAKGMEELYNQTKEFFEGKDLTIEAFSDQIAFNVIPHIDVFLDDKSTKEEWKMIEETKKILDSDTIQVAANCARVPVLRSHAEYINLEFNQEVSVADARKAFEAAPGVELMDDPETNTYPMPYFTSGKDKVYIGRLRQDKSVEHGLSFWNCADQLRKGAALNAVQILEVLITHEL